MPAAKIWQQTLAQQLPNVHIHSLPLIDITAIENTSHVKHLHHVWKNSNQFYAVAFVSRFAVEYFFAITKSTGVQFNGMRIRVWAVGQGTRHALMQVGVLPDLIDSPPADAQQFDSNTLWKQVAPQLKAQKKSVLLVRGIDDDTIQDNPHKNNRLEQILQTKKITHTSVFVYARKLPAWNAQQHAFALQLLQKNNVWLFSSSMAVLHLAHLMPQISATQWRMQQAVATHARIAQTTATLGIRNIQTCRPILDDVVHSIRLLCKPKLTP